MTRTFIYLFFLYFLGHFVAGDDGNALAATTTTMTEAAAAATAAAEAEEAEAENNAPRQLTLKQLDCTSSKYWRCLVSRVPPHFHDDNIAHTVEPSLNAATRTVRAADSKNVPTSTAQTAVTSHPGKIFETHVFYLNKVEPVSGELFVSATLRWRFKPPMPPRRAHRFIVAVFAIVAADSNHSVAVPRRRELGRFQVDLDTKTTAAVAARAQPVILIRFDNSDKQDSDFNKVLLTFGETYTFRVTEMEPLPRVTVNAEALLAPPLEKTVSFLSLLDDRDVAGCDAQTTATLRGGLTSNASDMSQMLALQRRRRELASRWSTSIREITFYPLHLLLNVSFYGAPMSHCIRQYAVELWFHGVVVHDRKFVDSSELVRIPTNNTSSALVGSVTFAGLERDTKYTIRIVPQEHNANGECICEFGGKCGCVTIRSNLFTLNNLYNFYDGEDELPTLEQPTIRIPSNDESSTMLYWMMAALFLALTFIFLALVLMLRAAPKTHEKRHYLFVHAQQQQRRQQKCQGDTRKPLLRETTTSAAAGPAAAAAAAAAITTGDDAINVLILNAETCHSAETALLARLIHDLSAGRINVIYDQLDSEHIEENVQRWAGRAVDAASKIILFHGRRAAAIIKNGALKRNFFDDAFYAAHAVLVYTDSRIMHAKWEQRTPTFFRGAEHIFVVPRDLCHILTAIGMPALSPMVVKLHEEAFYSLRKKTPGYLPLSLLPDVVELTTAEARDTTLPSPTSSSASTTSNTALTRSTSASASDADTRWNESPQQQHRQQRNEEQQQLFVEQKDSWKEDEHRNKKTQIAKEETLHQEVMTDEDRSEEDSGIYSGGNSVYSGTSVLGTAIKSVASPFTALEERVITNVAPIEQFI